VAAELSGAMAAATPAYAPEAPADRFIQTRVALAGPEAPGERSALNAFVRGQCHEIAVRVGVKEGGWLTPGNLERFPDEELSPSEVDHVLSVVLSSAGLVDEPLVGEVRLPRSGSSTEAMFFVAVPKEWEGEVDIRVIILHRNRVLQTARLRGPVAPAPREARIELEVEACVRRTLTDLGDRSVFDASLLLNHGSTGPGITTASDKAADYHPAPDLPELINWYDFKLSRVALDRRDFSGPLDSPPQVEFLRDLASKGAALFATIVTDGIGDGPLVRGERIQVLSLVPEERLPVELVYDRKRPARDAGLCPSAITSLQQGACKCNQPDDGSVICPFGFWGVSKILERHAHVPQFQRTGAAKFTFSANDPGERGRCLHALRAGVCGWSHRVTRTVDAEKLNEIKAALARPGDPVCDLPIVSWPDLQGAVKGIDPTVILLLVHMEDIENDVEQKAELGDDSWLDIPYLDETYVRSGKTDTYPIVFVLGCESGAPKVSFLGIASTVRRAGAAIVVTSSATIHSTHAVPLAASVLKNLGKAAVAGTSTMGEVMRSVRREMLAAGNPMVLCLSVFGDADWRLG